MSYRVDLPVFSGPLDLLLHLIKQQEVDIHEVAIASILEQYLAHLEVLEALDLADLGEFLVLASTLMEIKSRELLPNEEVCLEEEFDPKDDLIRRLLEYKRYRDASRRLHRYSELRARMMGASLPMPAELKKSSDDEPLLDLDNVEIWALTAAFTRLLEETGGDDTLHMEMDRRNMRYYTEHVMRRVKGRGEVRFEDLFDARQGRYDLIGVLIACLELMKQGVLAAHQESSHDPILMKFIGPEHLTMDQLVEFTEVGEVTPIEEAEPVGPIGPETSPN